MWLTGSPIPECLEAQRLGRKKGAAHPAGSRAAPPHFWAAEAKAAQRETGFSVSGSLATWRFLK